MKALSKPLRIALFTDDFYPASGGISRSIQAQINELVRLGHKVTLLAPKHYLEKPKDCETIILPSFYIPRTPSHTCVVRHDRFLARRISREHRFDIVHSQTERGGLILAARIAKIQQIPHVHTFHANLAGTHETDPVMSFWGSLAYFLLVNPSIALTSKKRIKSNVIIPASHSDAPSFPARFDWHSLATVASRVDAFSAPANFMVKRISECSDELNGRGVTIPTGVNPLLRAAIQRNEDKTTKDEETRFLSVCRLSREKRVDVIIEAFIDARIENSRLDIVGSGDQLKALQKLAKDHNNIIFHEHLSDMDDIARLYLSADVFVLASYKFDTQAITIAEAVVAGLPVIYCDERLDVGVTPDNSILASSHRSSDMAVAMKQLADKDTRARLAEASRKIAPHLTSDQMANQYMELYRQATNRHIK